MSDDSLWEDETSEEPFWSVHLARSAGVEVTTCRQLTGTGANNPVNRPSYVRNASDAETERASNRTAGDVYKLLVRSLSSSIERKHSGASSKLET